MSRRAHPVLRVLSTVIALLIMLMSPRAAAAADIVGRLPSRQPGQTGTQPDTLSVHLFLRGAEMVTTRRSGPITIERTIANGRIVPPFEVIRIGDRIVVTNGDDVPRRVIVFDGDRTRLIGPVAPGGAARLDAGRFGPIELASDAPGARHSLLFVAENPFMTRAGADGRFRFDGVPPGDYRVIAWSPAGYLGDWTVRLGYDGVTELGAMSAVGRVAGVRGGR